MVTAPGVDWVARSVGCRITDNVLYVVGVGFGCIGGTRLDMTSSITRSGPAVGLTFASTISLGTGRARNRSRGSVGDTQQVSGPATSGAA